MDCKPVPQACDRKSAAHADSGSAFRDATLRAMHPASSLGHFEAPGEKQRGSDLMASKQSHIETLVIYKLSAREFTAQIDLY